MIIIGFILRITSTFVLLTSDTKNENVVCSFLLTKIYRKYLFEFLLHATRVFHIERSFSRDFFILSHAHAKHVFQFPFILCLVDNAEHIFYHKQKSSCMLRILVGKAISMIIDYGDDSSTSMCRAHKENCMFSLLSSLLFICQQQPK